MFCHKCGKELLNNAEYCHYCGTAVQDNSKINSNNFTHNKISHRGQLMKISIIKFILYSIVFNIVVGAYFYFLLPLNVFSAFLTDSRGLIGEYAGCIGASIPPMILLSSFLLGVKHYGLIKKAFLLEIFFILMLVHFFANGIFNIISPTYLMVLFVVGIILLLLSYLKSKTKEDSQKNIKSK